MYVARSVLVLGAFALLLVPAPVSSQTQGRATITIGPGGAITVASAEDPSTGKITCGAGERCRRGAAIQWTVLNRSGRRLDLLELAGWRVGSTAAYPFVQPSLRARNIRDGGQAIVTGTIRSSDVGDGTYKYDVVATADGVDEPWRLDPELEIGN